MKNFFKLCIFSLLLLMLSLSCSNDLQGGANNLQEDTLTGDDDITDHPSPARSISFYINSMMYFNIYNSSTGELAYRYQNEYAIYHFDDCLTACAWNRDDYSTRYIHSFFGLHSYTGEYRFTKQQYYYSNIGYYKTKKFYYSYDGNLKRIDEYRTNTKGGDEVLQYRYITYVNSSDQIYKIGRYDMRSGTAVYLGKYGYTYDSQGNMVYKTYYNSSNMAVAGHSYIYDDYNNLVRINYYGGSYQHYYYTYDSNFNVTWYRKIKYSSAGVKLISVELWSTNNYFMPEGSSNGLEFSTRDPMNVLLLTETSTLFQL